MKKLQWNFNQNFNIFIQENAFQSIVCEMVSILPRPQCVKLRVPTACCVCMIVGLRSEMPNISCKNRRGGAGLVTLRKTAPPHMMSSMETFSALLALCEANPPITVGIPHRGQLRRSLMFSLISAWRNGWANNRDAGDLRRHRAYYDVTVMTSLVWNSYSETLPGWQCCRHWWHSS